MRAFRYYDFVMASMVAVLLCANLIGPAKVVSWTLPAIGTITFGAGTLFFPIGYIIGDILTEVYGYARARRAIWAGCGAMIFATCMSWAIIALPPSPAEPFNQQLQPALEFVFGNTGRIAIASILAYWVGDFANSFVLAKMKLWTNDHHLWSRVVGSTVVGQGLDSITFFPVAFYGIWTNQTMVKVVFVQLADESAGGDRVRPRHLRGGRFPQTRRRHGNLRPRHPLQPVLAGG